MDKVTAKKAIELVEEINELSEYKRILADKSSGKVSHIEFIQHYGKIDLDYDRVVFHHKYNSDFLPVIEKIINRLEDELEKL